MLSACARWRKWSRDTWTPALLLPAPGPGQQCCLKNVFNGIVLFLPVYGHCYGHIPSLQSPNCYNISSVIYVWMHENHFLFTHCSSSHHNHLPWPLAVSRHRQHQMMDNVDTKCCKKTNVQSRAANDPSVLIITEKAPRAQFSIVS